MFTIWHMTAHVIAVVSVIAGVIASNAIIGLIGVGIGMVILISARSRYRVLAYDERTLEISRRAASAAFRLWVVGLLILYTLNYYTHPCIGTMSWAAISDGLGMLICLMLCCYLGFYAYYRWRM
jgi:uncharacterized membrane protein